MNQTLDGRTGRSVPVLSVALVFGLAALGIWVLLSALGGAPPVVAAPDTLYVAGEGGADAPTCGTMVSPCQTISYTLGTRAAAGDVLRIAGGVYTENLTVNLPVTLEGGYEPVSWTRDLTLYPTTIDGSGGALGVGDWDGLMVRKPSVLSATDEYLMWYGGINLNDETAVGLATSAEGLTWSKSISNPVLVGDPGAWDEMDEHAPFVIEEGGVYKMWYEGSNGTVRQLGYATSTNGIDWTKYGDNPVLEAGPEAYDAEVAGHGSVLHDGGIYKLWYHAMGDQGAIIAYATSPDGTDWTKGGPVLTADPGGWDESLWGPSVLKVDDTYWMWYSAAGPFGPPAIGVVTSTDGISWTRFLTMPVIYEHLVGDPHVIYDGVLFKMWFNDFEQGTIAYAESADGIDWSVHEEPALAPGELFGDPGQPPVALVDGSDGVVLDGLILTGGGTEAGGGLYAGNGGTALIVNSVITGNHGLFWGGGIWATNGEVTILDTLVANNMSNGTAGIEANHDHGPVHLVLDTVTVRDNWSNGGPGGLQGWGDQATLEVVGSTLTGNHGGNGGGVALSVGASGSIEASTIYSNTADGDGGGVALMDGGAITITASSVYANVAYGGEGGGVAGYGGALALYQSWVVGNEAHGNQGGGIATGDGGSVLLVNSVVAGNWTGAGGGGFWFEGGGPYQIINSDIVGNEAAEMASALGFMNEIEVVMTNTLVISNTGNTGIDGYEADGAVITLSYCDTFGNAPDGSDGFVITRTNCLGAPPEAGLDPLFAGGALPEGPGVAYADQWLAYGYGLMADSPAVDAGTAQGAPPWDILGRMRDEMPDMGAYEYVLFQTYVPLVIH